MKIARVAVLGLAVVTTLVGCGSTAVDAASQPQWNTHCPKSGRPVVDEAYFEHEGTRVYFCNTGCSTDGAKDPELWIERVYGDDVPVQP
jgi:hypothetical protein